MILSVEALDMVCSKGLRVRDCNLISYKGLHNLTSLLRRLKAQTLPDATPPIGKMYPFTKMAVTFEPLMQF